MDIRTTLYPLGFLATFLFATRFILQWLESESKGKSVVSPSFWYVSLAANILLCIHTFIQVQYPFCLLQALNAVLAWRNLNLLSDKKSSFKTVIFALSAVAFVVTLAFIIQGYIAFGFIDWVRTPTIPWEEGTGTPVSLGWHILGFIGGGIFALRFWLQWWYAEKSGVSFINATFWWISLVGASIALIYFFHIRDWVNIAGYSLGIIPYARNLLLLRKNA